MRTELPSGWESAELGCLAQLINGDRGDSYPTKSSFVSDGVPFINAGHLNDGEITSTEMNYITLSAFQALRSGQVREDDILFCLRGSLGKVGLVKGIEKGAIASSLVIVRPIAQAHPRFLLYFLRSPLANKEIDKHNNGSAQPNLASKSLAKFVVPVAPIEEQKRIAEKLDTVLTRVDAVNTRLARVAPLLKRFRQSVFAAATSGRLTEDWRTANNVKPASDAVAGTPFCATQMANILSKARTPLKTGPFGTLLSKSEHVENGIDVVGIENIDRGLFRAGSKIHVTPEKALELSAYDLMPGDVIISRSGTVGEVCVVPAGLGELRFSTNIIRVVLNEEIIKPGYFVFLFLGCTQVLEQVDDLCKGSTRIFLNQTILNAISYPVPILEEQTEIVRRVETLFAFADRLEARLAQAQTAATRLTPALLAKAFRGELVPQDPNDEPAAELLRRLASSPTAPAKRGRAAKAT